MGRKRIVAVPFRVDASGDGSCFATSYHAHMQASNLPVETIQRTIPSKIELSGPSKSNSRSMELREHLQCKSGLERQMSIA